MLMGDRVINIPRHWTAIDREHIMTAMHVIYASSTVFREILVYAIGLVVLSMEFGLVHTVPTFVPLWNYHHKLQSWSNLSVNGTSFQGPEAKEQLKVIGGFAVLLVLECCNAVVVHFLIAMDIYPLRGKRGSLNTHAKLAREYSWKRKKSIEHMSVLANKRKRRVPLFENKSVHKSDNKDGLPEDGIDRKVTNASRRDMVEELSSRELLERAIASDWDILVFPTQVLQRHWREVLVLIACALCRGVGAAAYLNYFQAMELNYHTSETYVNETFSYRVMKFEEFVSAQIGQNYSDVSSIQNVQCIRDLNFCSIV